MGWALAALCFMSLANLGMRVAGGHIPSQGTMDQAALALCPRILGTATSQAFALFRKQVEPSGSTGVAASPSVQWLTAR
jgi:hypothetical protein